MQRKSVINIVFRKRCLINEEKNLVINKFKNKYFTYNYLSYLTIIKLIKICQSCGTVLTIKQIFENCRNYEKQREDLNISHLIGTSLNPNPDKEINTI